jgi:hypothetical protein
MRPRHAGPAEPWLGRWLGATSIFGALALVCLVLAYHLGDPFIGSPLAEALGALGYTCLVNGFVIGLSGLVMWVRARHERGE